jgi:glycerol uptake facilitator-like aquaporin
VYVTANISGGHLNPAVTLATLITGHTSIQKGLMYMAAQIAAAVLAGFVQVRRDTHWVL